VVAGAPRRLSSLADVARRAGVSITTASRVMSASQHPVAEHTRRRVLQAADELDFEPNLVARGLVAQRTSMVALLVGDMTESAASLTTRGAEDVAFEHGFSLLVGNTDGDTQKEVAYVRKLRALRADAVLLATCARASDPQTEQLARQLRQVESAGGVVVRLGSDATGRADVGWSMRDAFGLVAGHLRALGHRDVALVAGAGREGVTAAAVDAARGAARGEGLELPDDRVAVTDGQAGADERVLRACRDATAVITTCDEPAAAVVGALRRAGRRVPADVSVTGMGDLPIAVLLEPTLTTVRVPLREQGRRAMSVACDLLDGAVRPEPAEVAVELVVRDSSAPVVA
jgi:LacI family transcriptional regulator